MRSFIKTHFTDPLFLLSGALSVLGGVQAAQGYLTGFISHHPTVFGLGMTCISMLTGALTAAKNELVSQAGKLLK